MYAKVFSQIFDSSIAEDYQTRHVFMDLLVLADQNGCIDMTLSAIARRTNVPEEIITKAINVLMKPDDHSRTKDFDGTRLIKLDPKREWGWIIVNYCKYRDLRDEKARSEYMRDYMRKRREEANETPPVNTAVNTVLTPVNSVNTCKLLLANTSTASVSSPNTPTDSPIPFPDGHVTDAKPEVKKPKSFKQWTIEDLTASVTENNKDNLLDQKEAADFVGYWTEKSASGRLKLSLEQTWDTRRRMQTALRIVYERQRQGTFNLRNPFTHVEQVQPVKPFKPTNLSQDDFNELLRLRVRVPELTAKRDKGDGSEDELRVIPKMTQRLADLEAMLLA